MKLLIHSKPQRLHRWSLVMDNQLYPTFYCACDYLSMLEIKLIYFGGRVPYRLRIEAFISRFINCHSVFAQNFYMVFILFVLWFYIIQSGQLFPIEGELMLQCSRAFSCASVITDAILHVLDFTCWSQQYCFQWKWQNVSYCTLECILWHLSWCNKPQWSHET